MRFVRTLTQQRYPVRMLPNGAPDPCPGGEVPLLLEDGDEILLDDGFGRLLFANCGQAEPPCVEIYILCEDGETLLLEDGYELLYRGCLPYEAKYAASASLVGAADILAIAGLVGAPPPPPRLLNARGRAYAGALAPIYKERFVELTASAMLELGEGIRVRNVAEPISLIGSSSVSFDPWVAIPHSWLTGRAELTVSALYQRRTGTASLQGQATVTAHPALTVPSAHLVGSSRFEPGVLNRIVPAVEPLAGNSLVTSYATLHEPTAFLLGESSFVATGEFVGESGADLIGRATLAAVPLNRMPAGADLVGSSDVVGKQFLAELLGEARMTALGASVFDTITGTRPLPEPGTGNISVNRIRLTGQGQLQGGGVYTVLPVFVNLQGMSDLYYRPLIDSASASLVGRSSLTATLTILAAAAELVGGSNLSASITILTAASSLVGSANLSASITSLTAAAEFTGSAILTASLDIYSATVALVGRSNLSALLTILTTAAELIGSSSLTTTLVIYSATAALVGEATVTVKEAAIGRVVSLVGSCRLEVVANTYIAYAYDVTGESTIIVTGRYIAPVTFDLDGHVYPATASITGTTGDQSYPAPYPEPIDFVYDGGAYAATF